jgi:hypothetical protein
MLQGTGSLETISATTLKVPETRMADAMAVQAFSKALVENDQARSYKRARVNGLVDGRPPYKASKLREAGMSTLCNVNWQRANKYLEAGAGTFYDLFSEAPSYFTVLTAYGTPEQRQIWSDIISGEADRILRQSKVWDYEMQVSIDNMVLHGCGPLLFEDAFKCLPKAFLTGDLKVPEFTKSETEYWDACMIQAVYYPPELYNFIKDERAAAAVGWDVEFTKKVIANAMDIRTESAAEQEWEFYQAELKNNAYNYYNQSLICRLAHVFWKEFDGRITHAIVERDSASGMECRFLYLNIGRYAEFSNAIHPVYFDHGHGGYHHSVTGLGVKMYGAMEFENRLICNLADKAMAPKMLFKPGSTEASQRISLARFADYAVLPKGAESVQAPVQGLVGDALEMYELVKDVNSDVLGTYKQGTPQQSGNPPTKFQKMYEATMQAALSKTQLNRYYRQMDTLYQEIYRRLSNLNSTCEMAQEFQERCLKSGVPREAIGRTEALQATRVAGQGSGFMRKVAIDSLFPVAGALPEDGRNNLVRDKIAAEAGQHAVSRYFPQVRQPMASDQDVMAQTEILKMQSGMATKVASTQDPVTFAAAFTAAAMQAVASLQKGGDPHNVLRFLSLDGPAIAAHLQRFTNDPTRKGVHDALKQKLTLIAKATTTLKGMLAKATQNKKNQQGKQQQTMTDAQLKAAKLKADIQLKAQKQNATLAQRAQKQRFDFALADAQAAHDMTLDRISAFQE